jgi:hypothetical protein
MPAVIGAPLCQTRRSRAALPTTRSGRGYPVRNLITLGIQIRPSRLFFEQLADHLGTTSLSSWLPNGR